MMHLNTDVFSVFDKDWALLTAGRNEKFNCMTIGWGGLGTLWGKPVATVYVKPIRYTHAFMEQSEYFTVSFYEKTYRKALGLFGSLSGKDTDKVKAAGFHPIAVGDAVTFREARLTLLCKKIYRQDLDISAMPRDVAEDFYETEAAHTMYIGEVIEIVERGENGS